MTLTQCSAQAPSGSADELRTKWNITSQEIEYVYHPSFSLPQTDQRLWGEDCTHIEVRPYDLVPQEQTHRRLGRSSLSKDEEKTLFLRYNYARYRLARSLQTDPDAEAVKRWLQRVRQMRRDLVHANLPLVPSLAKRLKSSSVELPELLSEGYLALLRAVEKFDVGRGYKFSTYACRAILSSFYCRMRRLQSRRKHIPAHYEPEMEQDDFLQRRHDDQYDQATEAVRNVLTRTDQLLSPIENEVLRQRFPMLRKDSRPTLAQLGRQMGISNERVRQIERKSLQKLRDAIEEELAN